MSMTEDQWMREAKRWALHAYCYEGMVDEFPDYFVLAWESDLNPYDTVDTFANDANLDRQDGFYGINSNKKFVKLTFTKDDNDVYGMAEERKRHP